MTKIQQLASLNGWRAVAILLVLRSHTALINGFPFKESPDIQKTFFDDNLGVRIFFTISGFLITWLLLKEEIEFGSISLKNFYLRRILRIWPVYLACLALLAILQFSGIAMEHGYAWRGLFTFTRNFYDPQWIYDESMGPRNDGVSFHCWSLSIEEQFYLFWPLLFGFIRKTTGRIGFLTAVILFSAGFKTISLLGLYDRHFHILFEERCTFFYLDCLGWGCLAAIAFTVWKNELEFFFEKYRLIILAASFCLVLIPRLLGFGTGIQAVGITFLLLHSVISPDWIFYRFLNFRWMNRIGILSYSLYMWNQMIFTLWPKTLAAIWFLWLPLAFGIAWASFHFLEKPFVALRAKLHDPNARIKRLVTSGIAADPESS